MEEMKNLCKHMLHGQEFNPTDQNSDDNPSYESSLCNEYNLHPSMRMMNKLKGNVNSGSVEKDTHNSKRASMFYTSKEEIALNDFCRDQVKPLLNELLDYFDGFQNLFQRDIKDMKDAFEQNDVYLDEIERQNDFVGKYKSKGQSTAK
ncbi:hypothetical protein Tco_0824941 [Tanacetum coccineum]